MKRFYVFLSILIQFCIVSNLTADDEKVYEGLSNFTKVLDLIDKNYVDEVDTNELTVSAIEGMLSTLDAYSGYLTPDQFKELEIDTYGEFGGIGVELTVKNGELTVIAPIEGTPAHEAGIEPEDKIISIDGKSTEGMSSFEAARLLRGPRGSILSLTVESADKEVKHLELVREIIVVKSVKSSLLEDNIAYIKLLQFQKKSYDDFIKSFNDLKEKSGNSLKGLIVDLRNNPGGLLDQAIEIADDFLEKGLIVSVRGRSPLQTQDYVADEEVNISKINSVILVNRGSASASEVLAGALKDSKIAKILGEKTFGKGSVQTIVELEDGSGVKITTARFYTPNGSTINNVGIIPDVVVSNKDKGEDVQLSRALELLKYPAN